MALDKSRYQDPKLDTEPLSHVPGAEIPHTPAEVGEEVEVGEMAGEQVRENKVGAVKATPVQPTAKPSGEAAAPQVKHKDPTYEAVEDILEEDLGDIYFQMDPKHQKQFKEKGEETAGMITRLVKATQATMKKVLGLIRLWLKVVPGINKFFLEQEAKIKTDEVMKLEEEMEKTKS